MIVVAGSECPVCGSFGVFSLTYEKSMYQEREDPYPEKTHRCEGCSTYFPSDLSLEELRQKAQELREWIRVKNQELREA